MPAHVHVEQAERYTKFWLDPVSLARSRGPGSGEVDELERIVESNQAFFRRMA
jgi:hypothetical protein